MLNESFREWYLEKYDMADDDFMDEHIWFFIVNSKEDYDGSYREITDRIWHDREISEDMKFYLQEGLDKIYLKYVYEKGL